MKNLFISFLLLSILSIVTSCSKSEEEDTNNTTNNGLPIVKTISLTKERITHVSAIGIVESDGGNPILEQGFCWAMHNEPSYYDVHLNASLQSDSINLHISHLKSGTTYYARAFAKNKNGIAYGVAHKFTTVAIPTGTVQDHEGNTYKTVTLYYQTWMAENLKVVTYKNGDSILTDPNDSLDMELLTNPAYQWAYNHDPSNATLYGRLYTWYVVKDSRGICPEGYRIPHDTDWVSLTNNIGLEVGNQLKESGSTYWNSGNTGTNECMFNVLGAGQRDPVFYSSNLKQNAYFWSATEKSSLQAQAYTLGFAKSWVDASAMDKTYGFSIRCIKN